MPTHESRVSHASQCPPLPRDIRAELCPSHRTHPHAARVYHKVLRVLQGETQQQRDLVWATLTQADRMDVLRYRQRLVQMINLRCRECSAWGSEKPTSDVDFTVSPENGGTDMSRSVATIGRVFQTIVRIFPGVHITRVLAFFDINFYFTNFAQPLPSALRGRPCSGAPDLRDLHQYHLSDEYEGPTSQFRFAFVQLLHSRLLENSGRGSVLGTRQGRGSLARRYRAWMNDTLTQEGTAAAGATCEWPHSLSTDAERALLSQYFSHPVFPCLMREVDKEIRRAESGGGTSMSKSNRIVLLTSLLSCLEEESYRTQGAYCFVVLQQQQQQQKLSTVCPLVCTKPHVARVVPNMLLACALENLCFAAVTGTFKYVRRADAALRLHPDHKRLGLRVPRVPHPRLVELASSLLEALISVKQPQPEGSHTQEQLVTAAFATRMLRRSLG
jgi:hypothetical protein